MSCSSNHSHHKHFVSKRTANKWATKQGDQQTRDEQQTWTSGKPGWAAETGENRGGEQVSSGTAETGENSGEPWWETGENRGEQRNRGEPWWETGENRGEQWNSGGNRGEPWWETGGEPSRRWQRATEQQQWMTTSSRTKAFCCEWEQVTNNME